MFYLNFVRLCNSIGKSPSAVAEEMGFQRSVVTRWSNGSVPRKATLEKIASYFGVSSADLTGEAQKEKPNTPEGVDLSGLSPEDAELVELILKAPASKKNAIRELL